eukprot:410477-Rhodomonas_salina.2
MSGTGIAHGPVLRSCYAMSGTDIAYGAAVSLRARYAMSGTEIRLLVAYLPTLLLCDVQYSPRLWYC